METLLHAALSNAVSATLLALLVACLGRVLARRPAILHCLWLLVLLKLVTPPLYEVPIPWPESLSPGEKPAATVETLAIVEGSPVMRWGFEELPEQVTWVQPEAQAVELEAPATETDAALAARAALVSAVGWLSLHWVPAVGFLWLAGTLATVLISVRRILQFQRVLREATPGTDEIQSRVIDLAASLGVKHPPQISWIGGKVSPMLWAFLGRPRLIIPKALWKGLDERQRETLLIHELAHLKRGDHRVRIFELVVTALYWWNPVLWWVRQALRDVEEQCCDAWVVWAFPEAAKSYAETLIETLDFLNKSELSEPLLASGFGKVHHLRRRLTMIMSGTTPRLVGLRGTLAAVSLGALLLPVSASWAQKPEEQKEVRVVVKTDDGAENAVNAYVVDDSSTPVVGSIRRSKDGEPAYVVRIGSDASLSADDENSHVGIFTLHTNGTTYSVSADSVDDAIKKINEQIQLLKAKVPLGEKDKAQQEALLQIAKQFEELAKSGKAGSIRPGAGLDGRFVVRLVDVNGEAQTPAKKAEIEAARAEVKKLSASLAEAQRKLALLEGGPVDVKVVRFHEPFEMKVNALPRATQVKKGATITVDSKVLEKPVTVTRAIKGRAVTTVEPKKVRVTKYGTVDLRKTDEADEDRIQALEKKLNEVIEALDKLKKSKAQ